MSRSKKYGGDFDLELKIKQLEELKMMSQTPDFWSDQKKSEKVIKEINSLNSLVKPLLVIKDNIELLTQYEELLESDDETKQEIEKIYNDTVKLLKEQEIAIYLSGEFDNNNSIFEIHAGAGGTESCDWALMLSRMYTKFFDKKDYKYEIIDEQPGEETGIKSITYLVKGTFSYGFLKCEKGVHRLVRLSPFDANNRRHTSFAAVDVIPEFEDNVDIEIKDTDVRIDVYRSSGAGGQGVNTTDSAVRVTHIPTGIVVTCQNERSQIKNKEIALKILKSKLYQKLLKEQKDKIDNMKSSNSDIEFGSQIRSYVLHPYSLIKDHRTNYETSNVNKVLDGELEEFINSYLRKGDNNENI